MQSTAKDVTAYLDEVPAGRKPALARLRDLCRRSLRGFEESMKIRRALLLAPGRSGSGFCQPEELYWAVYPQTRRVECPSRSAQSKRSGTLGKGCIRYSKPEKIDFRIVEMLLKATQESTGEICGHNAI